MQASENIKKNDRDGAKPLPPKPNAKKPSGSALRVDTSIKQDRNHKDPDAIAPVAEPNQRASEEYEPAPITGFSKQRSRPDELCRSRYLTMFSTTTEKPSHHIKSVSFQRPSCWTITSWVLTWWAPPCFLRLCGIHDKQMQQAWREKVTLVQFILLLCIAVGFLTFGFNATVCGRQPMRIQPAGIQNDQIVISGRAFDLKTFRHPTPVPNMPGSGDLQELGVGGMDLSFLFQTVNYNCKGILHPVIQDDAHGNVANYFPCVPLDRFHPEINSTSNPQRIGCHISPKARNALKDLTVVGDVYYNWTDIQQPGTSLVAFNGNVLDISRLRFLTPNIPMPLQIAQIVGPGSAFIGRDATYWLSTTADRLRIGKCMTDILKVGVLDTRSTGCIISDIVLWVSLAVILGVVLIRFLLALIFGWCISWKLGSIREETAEERRKRQEAVLHWEMNNVEQMHYPKSRSIETVDHRDERSSTSGGIGATGPHALQNTSSSSFSGRGAGSATSSSIAPKKRRFLPTTSRFTQPPQSPSYTRPRGYNSPLTASQDFPHSPSTMPSSPANNNNNNNSNNNGSSGGIPYTFSSQFFYNTPLQNSRAAAMALQARKQYNFNFDLIHTFMVVTCYSEGEEGLRTTLDSLANTDYPATHKLLLVICDGIITGSGNTMSTPDTVLSMMKDDIVPRDEVKACSYVAIADGVKRHNMAKVYAGYYRYNDDPSKAPEVRPEEQQQYVPMIVIVKCGTEAEARDKKPGNRGKRDSQVILMNAMQKVYYGERMCALEYQFCKAIVKLTGFHPSCYETCLMVDADTKVYPDSLARMVACMSRDPYIMGLCGETKIANKSDSWVTAIQVFEYYISHHMSKAFESIFGGVTCLPGCFCMYRIIAPKGDRFVPIFCSTDIVEMYCENIVDTLHKKNLLLLGEDRYLTTLMLRTFPKRKMIFVPQAVCKTVVPDTFSVLLSQRRRWINSTVHNLLELVLIRDLCGTFCFSMQFVVFMELVGTVVLPAAISFTFYLIIISCYVRPIPIIPLMLLAAILGLPAVLIALTTCKMVYVVWMLVYLFSLPIWNFVLPAYAYWHFDDFSWGQTRQVKGSEGKREDHGRREGQFDSTGIVMRRFEEWHKHERTLMAEGKSGQQTLVRNYPTIYYGH